MIRIIMLGASLLLSLPQPIVGVIAGEVTILKVEVTPVSKGKFRFDVTVRHEDEGWKHYANRWQVEAPEGKILGTRVLLHPHVNEQPFTRSLTAVNVPADVKNVVIRAFDSVHADSDKTVNVMIPH